jgi:hypothetical protein
VLPDDLMRNGISGEWNLGEPTPRRLDGLSHGFGDFVRLARREAHTPLPIADRDQRIEREAPAAFHDLCDAIDRDDVLDEIATLTRALVAARAWTATFASAVTTVTAAIAAAITTAALTAASPAAAALTAASSAWATTSTATAAAAAATAAAAAATAAWAAFRALRLAAACAVRLFHDV